ncbi:ABC transporter permease, partial [bacterium]|nr:ABC transporter permease [bacterium]
YIFPTTYALKAIRLNLLKGVGLSQLYHELIIMIVLTVIFLPLSILFFNHSIKKAKEWGILGNY